MSRSSRIAANSRSATSSFVRICSFFCAASAMRSRAKSGSNTPCCTNASGSRTQPKSDKRPVSRAPIHLDVAVPELPLVVVEDIVRRDVHARLVGENFQLGVLEAARREHSRRLVRFVG